MIKTKNVEPLELFYSKYFMFSYSSLNKLLHSATLFYNWYIRRDREDAIDSYLVNGKVIHCLVLEEEVFDDHFVVMPGSLPGISNKKICDTMYKAWQSEDKPVKSLLEYKDQILQWLVDNSLHQKLTDDKDLTKSGAKTAKEKQLEKVLTTKAVQYFDYLQRSENKNVVTQEILDRCLEAATILKENKTVTELLKSNLKDFPLIEVYNEQALSCQLVECPFGLKGIIDNYVIDHTKKTVYVNDLKTTGKTLSEFKDTVNYYNYWMQASIYLNLVKANHPETSEYEYVFHFIVIDKYNQVYPFPVSKQSLLDWQIQLEENLKIAKYHYTKKDYTLPYEFAVGQVTL